MTKQSETPPLRETTNQPSSTSSFPSKPTKSKLPIILLIIIVLFISSYIGYLIGKCLYKSPAVVLPPSPFPLITKPTPTPDQIANWKTYTDLLGYSFSYPQGLELETYDDKAILRIDPPDLRTVEGICPRYIAFSPVNNESETKDSKNKYSCVNKSLIKEGRIFIETQYPESQENIINQILSTFKFTQ